MPEENNKHEVVISGISGLFPESDDINELWERLVNKDDMITIDARRWMPGEFEVPPGTGKIRHPEKFDMAFFGVNRRLCEKMDPYARLECEQAYRAVCDAGVNPGALDGSGTAVIMSCFMSEPENDLASCMVNMGTYNVLAVSRTMQANRISYFMNLKGPSFSLDCQGCGGFVAIQQASELIARGACTAAIVGCCSSFHKPEPSFHFKVMGRLSEDSVTRSFSADASGYARSEGCVTMFLQRKDLAKRIYGTILGVNVFTHGSKSDQFCEFPIDRFHDYLQEVYEKAKVDPKDVSYIEAYGAASKNLDAFELNALSKFMLPGRKEPLLIGSVKSNLGHTEGASAMVSLTKVLMSLDRGVIPPNINYSAPNPQVPDLVSGKLKVVTEPTPVTGNIMAVSEIGFTGVCSHMIVKGWEKAKPQEEPSTHIELPYLITMSGRSKEGMEENMARFVNGGVNAEFAILVNNLYKDGIRSHAFRGFTVVSDAQNNYNNIEQAPSSDKSPIWFMYSGMGSQWPTMAKSLLMLPVFAKAIHKCHEVLLPKGVNLMEIITKDDSTIFDVILNSFVGIAAIQIGLTDVLRAVGVQPDGIIGHSVGELGCAYADGCLTAEQMILSAHARGRASVEATLIKGMMAAVGTGYNTIKSRIPESIEVACHNSKDSCTLSGPADDMEAYIGQLKKEGMFAKLVNVANIAYHSRYIKPAAPSLLKYLKEIIPVPMKRSSRWISSSNRESEWNTELAQYSSAEYHTNNLLSSVLFEEASAHIPSKAIVIEIAPHGLLQAIVKKSLPNATHIPLTSRFDPNNLMYLLAALGKMYLNGIPIDIQGLYPNAQYPVSRNTLAISPLIDWLRDENFCIRRRMNDTLYPSPICTFVEVGKNKKHFNKLSSHKVNGRTILPFSFYFENIINLFVNNVNNDDGLIIIEDLCLIDDIEITEHSTKEIRFHLLPGTGTVAISDFKYDDVTVCRAKIKPTKPESVNLNSVEVSKGGSIISRNEMMSFMRSMGVERDTLVHLDQITVEGSRINGVVQWNGNIGEFITSLLALAEFYITKRDNILKLFYQADCMYLNLPLLTENSKESFVVTYSDINKTIECQGVRISSIQCRIPNSEPATDEVIMFHSPQFVPYYNDSSLTVEDFMNICTQLVFENTNQSQDTLIKIMEIGNDSDLILALRESISSSTYTPYTQVTSFASEESFFKTGVTILLQKDVWLVFDEPPSNELLKYLSVFRNGFVLMPSHANGLTGNASMRVIFESFFNDKWYSLFSTHDNYSARQYEVVNLDEYSVPNLRVHLDRAGQVNDDPLTAKTIILMGEVDSVLSIDSILEKTRDLPNIQLLQYWFFVGMAPSFNSDDSMKKQLERRVKINISYKGVWGSLRQLPVNIADGTSDIKRVSSFYYPLSAILQTENIKALGLNLPDNLQEVSNWDLGLYDYVTDGVIGIGNYDPHEKKFTPDKILAWDKPSHWSLTEAATIPYYYSLASYIVNTIFNPVNICRSEENILVNQAMLPLSQAIISMAIFSKVTVYATVYGDEEKYQLLKLYPELKRDYIFDCSTPTFYVDVLRLTRGVNKVINNFDSSQMVESCKNCASLHGVLVFTNKLLIDTGVKMGMSVFGIETFAIGVSGSILWENSDIVKKEIQRNVNDAIKMGAVKPIATVSAVPSSIMNTDAANFIKSVHNSKVVTILESHHSDEWKKVYLQDENKSHVILEGDAPEELTLDIFEWLLKRGCRKLLLFTRRNQPSESSTLRLQSLLNHYIKAEINIKRIDYLSSKANVDKFMRGYPGAGPMMVFYVGTGLIDKIEQFNEILANRFPQCNMIWIGSDSDSICEHRKNQNLPVLYIKCNPSILKNGNLTRYLDSLVKQSTTTPVVCMKKCGIHSRPVGSLIADLAHLPDTLKELQKLYYQSPSKAKFVEVGTLSPRHLQNREVYPVFMIPGLRPGRLHKMATQLYSPAYEARLPSGSCDINEIATDLADQLLSRKQNMFTIVTESWGGILALYLASKLEERSKIVNIIFLDATPASIKKWATELLKNDGALVGKYLRISPEDNLKMRDLHWESKLNLAVDNSDMNQESEKKLTKVCLDMLHTRLQSVVCLALPQKKLEGKFHVLQMSSLSEEDHGLHDYVESEPTIHLMNASSVSEMIDSQASDEINSLHLFEYIDAANPPIDEYNGMNVVKKPLWYASQLFRVIE